MKEKIKQVCEDIEKKENVRILFSVENGSRAWRMASKNSDYDVRFVFVRPLKEYIQINSPKEVINHACDENLKTCPAEEALIDMSGFDIFKFVRLLHSSNPTTIEWLMSDIIYHGEQNETFKKFAKENFNPQSLCHHYKSMCKNNYIKYLKSGNFVTYKKYLYSYRGLVNAKWVAHKKTLPPIKFSETVKGMEDIIPKEILNKLNQMIELKSQGKEEDKINNIVEMDNYIEDFLKEQIESPKKTSSPPVEELNCELRDVVMKNVTE